MGSTMKVREISDPAGGRNLIRSGDGVRVRRGGADPTGFAAVMIDADVDASGQLVAVTVFGGRGYDPAKLPRDNGQAIGQFRTIRPERIRRLSQAHIERRRA